MHFRKAFSSDLVALIVITGVFFAGLNISIYASKIHEQKMWLKTIADDATRRAQARLSDVVNGEKYNNDDETIKSIIKSTITEEADAAVTEGCETYKLNESKIIKPYVIEINRTDETVSNKYSINLKITYNANLFKLKDSKSLQKDSPFEIPITVISNREIEDSRYTRSVY